MINRIKIIKEKTDCDSGSFGNTRFKKGHIPWIKGKTHSLETRNKIKLSNIGKKLTLGSIKKRTETRRRLYLEGKLIGGMKGKYQSDGAKQKISNARIGRTLSKETIKKISGKNSYLWKGGITTFQKNIRNNRQYRQWVSSCMTRDNWTCDTCNKRGGELQVHHIISFSELLNRYNIKSVDDALKCKELWDLNNGITLCSDCHKETDTYLKQPNHHSQINDMSVEDYKPLQK